MKIIQTKLINGISYTVFLCSTCEKETTLQTRTFNHRLKKSKTNRIYCSLKCSHPTWNISEEGQKNLWFKQKGISVMSRGRKGRIISQEVRDKIRNSKLGVPSPKDWEGMRKELNMYEGLIDTKVIPLIKPVPDGILIQNGQVIAVEIEKEPYEYGIRTKMKYYDNIKYFDKVIIIWYRDNERIGEYHKINGVWSGLIPTPAG
ncbi:MAG: hypothetical protein KGI05_09235 [Thaumarchaeota archaeon]|nr:hypothetical protein [Nitrososphaerota archaeon]